MTGRTLNFFTLLLFMCSCYTSNSNNDLPDSAVDTATSREEVSKDPVDIYTAVFEYLYEESEGLEVFYIGLADEAILKQVIDRFEDLEIPVRDGETAGYNKEADCPYVYNPDTGNTTKVHSAGEIRWIADDTVEVDASYYTACLGAGGMIIRLKWLEESWRVRDAGYTWIS